MTQMTQDKLVPHRFMVPAVLAAGLTLGIAWPVGAVEPFKVANIHFETNASACDMGIQIIFDTDGITEGSVTNPKGGVIYEFESKRGMKAIGGQTEGFLEGVEPQITELLSALGCECSNEEPEISIKELLAALPSGNYTLKGRSPTAIFRDRARLTHFIPAGAE